MLDQWTQVRANPPTKINPFLPQFSFPFSSMTLAMLHYLTITNRDTLRIVSHMSTTSVSESIIHWLSRVDSHISPTSSQPSTPSTASKSPCTSRKRRQSHDNERDTHVIKSRKRQRTRQQPSRPALREVTGNAMNPTFSPSPSHSPTKSGRKDIDVRSRSSNYEA